MKKSKKFSIKTLLVLTAVIIILIVTAMNKVNYNSDEFIESWTADIEFFRETITNEHKDPFAEMSEEEFNKSVDALLEKVNTLREDEIIIEMNRIMDVIGDEESRIIDNSFTLGYLGVNIDEIEGKFIVLNTSLANKEVLYKEVIEVNDIPIREIRDKFKKIIPSQNEYWDDIMANSYLSLTHYYEAFNYFNTYDEVFFTIIDDGNEKEVRIKKAGIFKTSFVVKNIMNDYHHVYSRWIYKLPEYEYRVDGNVMIFNINKTFNIDDVSEDELNKIISTYSDSDIEKLVIDFRTNLYENINYSDFLIDLINSREDIIAANNIYYLISNRSFSAGAELPALLKTAIGGILVGEPTGGSPNGLYSVQYKQFPNSSDKIILYSTDSHDFYPEDHDVVTLVPDIQINYTLDDYMEGNDPVMEYIYND